jgi:hypothetical protein
MKSLFWESALKPDVSNRMSFDVPTVANGLVRLEKTGDPELTRFGFHNCEKAPRNLSAT